MPTVSQLNLYPVKGFQGQSVTNLTIMPELGIEGDRQSAFAKRPTQPEAWTDRGLYCAVNSAALVNVPATQATPQTVQNLLELPSPPKHLHGNKTFNFAYNAGPTVSLLNLATVNLFEDFLRHHGKLAPGQSLNPERFRMNVHIEGWPAFAELTLPEDAEFTIGTLRFRVREACIRCKAIHANPQTGTFDLSGVPLLTRFMEEHCPTYRPGQGIRTAVMGLILNPLTRGTLQLNDPLTL